MIHYLDNAATTPVRPEAAQAALDAMQRLWWNPSSQYGPAQSAKSALEGWRRESAQGLGCRPEEFFFTSGGTEGDNWAIAAAAELGRHRGKHIITTAIEHDGVLQPCKALEQRGYTVTYLKPDRNGAITADQVRQALRPDTVLVSMMLVNNELGTVLPVAETAAVLRAARSAALLHCDAVQGFLKIPFTPEELGVDLLSVSGHKIHAPKGIGGFYVRKGLRLLPLIRGGGQEGGLRSGTEPTAQIAAFAAAVQAGRATFSADTRHAAQLKQYAIDRLKPLDIAPVVTGGCPHILPIALPGYRSEVLLRFLSDREIYVSSGSACHRGKPSHVFAALNLPKKQRDGVLRVSFSYDTRKENIDALADALAAAKRELFMSMS